MAEYKYQSELAEIPDCPPDDARTRRIKAFRYVFEDREHPKNFLPALKIKPKRKIVGDRERCMAYGLSMFDSFNSAKTRYAQLLKKNPKLWKTLGTHIAEGWLTEADGKTTETDEKGHFTLHEFKETNLKAKFRIVSRAS